jgi:hypothetical protein
VVLLLALFMWSQASRRDSQSGADPERGLAAVLAALGWSGNRFDLMVTSQPPGASIRVDTVTLAERTPSRIRLKPGERQLRVFFPDFGGEDFSVQGRKGESLRLDAVLWGAVSVISPEPESQIQVSLDGEARGTVPLLVDRVAPGPHQLRFSGSGFDPWERTVRVIAGQTHEVSAVPTRTPGTGILHVRAVTGEQSGSPEQAVAQVYVDRELRGRTPLTLELPRGPHSVRAVLGSSEAPVQVVDLPGGNERFVTVDFGTGEPALRMWHEPPPALTLHQPVVVTVSLTGDPAPRVREMWLNVQIPDAPYRRYPMTLLPAPGGAAGSAVFPTVPLDASGATRYYVSALTEDGEEHYTEVIRLAVVRPGTPDRATPSSRQRPR